MKKIFLILISSSLLTSAYSQSVICKTSILSKEESAQITTDFIKKQLNIQFPVWKAYKCEDQNGTSYLLLTENTDTTDTKGDTISRMLKAIKILEVAGTFVKEWEINDFTLIDPKINYNESAIWFWTKYCSMDDLDKDALIDPIIVYGTAAGNGISDGRIKIVTIYKGKKIVIRHQNSNLDFFRKTQIDADFYSMPTSIQEKVISLMTQMETNQQAIFPGSWKQALAKKSLNIAD